MRIPLTRKEVSFSPAHDRRLYLIGNPQDNAGVVSPEHITGLQKKVVEMLAPVRNTNVYIGGGNAIAYALTALEKSRRGIAQNLVPKNVQRIQEGYYRDHAALDILCFEDNLENVARAFESAGKYLVGRGPMLKVSSGTKLETYQPLSPKEALTRKNLRITNGTGEYLNLYLHHFETAAYERVQKKEDGSFISLPGRKRVDLSYLEVVSNEDNVRVKITDFEGHHVRIAPEMLIKLAHPLYLIKAKVRALREKNKDDPRHGLDIEVLEKILEYIGREVTSNDLSAGH